MKTCTKCDKPSRSLNLCNKHYVAEFRSRKKTCSKCDNKTYAHGVCKAHYMVEYRKNKPVTQPFDVEDFWLFVKKELDIA